MDLFKSLFSNDWRVSPSFLIFTDSTFTKFPIPLTWYAVLSYIDLSYITVSCGCSTAYTELVQQYLTCAYIIPNGSTNAVFYETLYLYMLVCIRFIHQNSYNHHVMYNIHSDGNSHIQKQVDLLHIEYQTIIKYSAILLFFQKIFYFILDGNSTFKSSRNYLYNSVIFPKDIYVCVYMCMYV